MTFARLRRRTLQVLFDLLYRSGNWVYDPLTAIFFGPAWHNWRRTALPWVGKGRVLEIGCGTGQLLSELADRSDLVVGLDQSGAMLQRARRQASSREINLIHASAEHLPIAPSMFDTVISTFPASFIARRSVLDQIAGILRPGGHFVVVASARYTRFQWRRPFVHPVLRVAYGSSESMNRWPADLLVHPEMPGEWQDLRTPEGEGFVWIATKRQSSDQAGGSAR